MKKLITSTVCFILAGSLVAKEGNDSVGKKTAAASPAPAGAPPIQLVLELSDGSRINGTTAIDRLKIKAKYATMEFQLSKVRMIEFGGPDHVAQVDLQNGDQLSGQLAAKEIAVKSASRQIVVQIAHVSKIRVGVFVNSLGMEFVRVPGLDALFSVWDTRVKDYRVYAEANPGVDAGWKDIFIGQDENNPVVFVTWSDANAFCVWLTRKERKEGKISNGQEYRLPMDSEWSVAVGPGKYPWGDQWPPPKGAGNYGTGGTCRVGSFKANQYGLYDMGGNVMQFCEDVYRDDMNEKALLDRYPNLKYGNGKEQIIRVARGADNEAYNDLHGPYLLLSSYREPVSIYWRMSRYGFRCVLAPVPSSR